jgi:hypothetical protein
MSAQGQTLPIDNVRGTSALPPITTELVRRGERRKGPRSDIDLLAAVRAFYPDLNAAERRELAVHVGVLRGR